MIKRFISYYRPHIRLFLADMLCALILSACDLCYPMLTRAIINVYIPDKNLRLIVIFCGGLLAIYLLKLLLNYFVQYYGHVVGIRMQADMRRDLFSHLEKLPFSFFDNNKTGSLMSRITNDLTDITELAHHGPEDLFISLVLLIGSFILLAGINLPLTLIVFASLPVMVFFAAKKRRAMADAFARTRVELAEVNAGIENSISGIRVSKAYTNDEYENAHFETGNRRYMRARARALKVMAEFSSGTTFITDFLNVVVLLAGGIFFMNGSIKFGDFTAFLLYVGVFLSPIKRLIGFVEQYQNGMSGFARFCEISDTEPELDAPDAKELNEVRGEIEFCDVGFSYDAQKPVLSGLSFKVEAGKTLALVGPSGGGKTTICNIIPRFYDVSGGRVLIDGTDITTVTRKSLRCRVGIVSQDVFLFDTTIAENISYGNPDATREEIIEAARRANIDEFARSLPGGYDTQVGERGVKLSGGQKQRLAIARAFLKNPPILILDEATSALDNTTEMLIQESLEELSRGRTVIVVAHRLSTVRNADEILVLTDEGIAERGTHPELIEKGGIYANLYISQFRE